MSNGTPPTTIEAWPRLATGRVGIIPPNIKAYGYQPNTEGGLIPAVTPPPIDIEGYPGLTTNGIGIAADAGVWQYQPNVPYGMIEIIPSLVPPTNTVAPLLTYISGGGGTGNVGSQYALGAGTWTPSTPTPTYIRQWLRNGTPIAGATGTTYTIATADIGTTINAIVTATNPAGSSAPVQSSNSIGPIPDPDPPDEDVLDDNGGAQRREDAFQPPRSHHAKPKKKR